jgi:hypothetical protein
MTIMMTIDLVDTASSLSALAPTPLCPSLRQTPARKRRGALP